MSSDSENDTLSEGSSLSESEIPEATITERRGKTDLKCFCMSPLKAEDIMGVLKTENALTIDSNCIDCHISNLERCVNFLIQMDVEGLSWQRLMMADCFFRYRHEITAVMVLRALKLEITGTDKSFRDFGVESDRTPDYIILKDGIHYIIEFVVTANEEKSAQMKGVISAGFESKYQREMNMMTSSGMKVNYTVLMFNVMDDQEDSEVWENLNKLVLIFNPGTDMIPSIKSLFRGLSRLTKRTRSYMTLPASLLFSPSFNIEKKHEEISFCYENKDFVLDYEYKDFNISTPVYIKINNLWDRLSGMKERQVDTNHNYFPLLDVSSNRMKFINHPTGVSDEFMENLFRSNDKQGFFEVLRLKIGNKFEMASKSETGVKYTKRVPISRYTKEYDLVDISCSHEPKIYTGDINEEDIDKYLKMQQNHKEFKYCPTYYDENYERKLIESMLNFDKENSLYKDSSTFKIPPGAPKTLSNYNADDINTSELCSGLLTALIERNSFEVQIPVKIKKMKQSFILPMACLTERDRGKISEKNEDFIMKLVDSGLGEYTKTVLLKVLDESYNMYSNSPPPSEALNKLYKDRFEVSNSITKFVKDKMKGSGGNKFDRNSLNPSEKVKFSDLINNVSGLGKSIRVLEKKENIVKNIGMVRLQTKGRSLMSRSFREEMSHFKDRSKQSSIEGIGLKENLHGMQEGLITEFDTLSTTFTMNCGENRDFLIDLNTYNDCKLLSQLKQHTIDTYKVLINQIKNSFLGHASAFVSRYAHSLLFYSQLPFNGSYVRVDNLGYKNVLLMVKGGSKVFKTKSSKLHRLIFPTTEEMALHYSDESYGQSSFKKVYYRNDPYIVTPWIMLHESILMDSVSFYPRVISFCTLNLDPELTFSSQIHKVFLNVVLAFHNRRQTESMLANMRYILLSTMGDFSAFQEIFSEFVGFNYDKVQAFIRLQIISNYPQYFNTMRKIQKLKNSTQLDMEGSGLRNLFTQHPITSADDLALMIYSTFLMTKAPYQRSVERANNLKGILEIQDLFDKTVGLDLNPKEQLEKVSVINEGDYLSYSKKLMSNDFALDPLYCTNIGIFADSYLRQNVGSDDLLNEWVKILNKNWDSMATTTGLRGMESKNFFGKKGFFVIYDHLLNKEGYKEKIFEIFSSEKTDDEKRKKIRDLNQTYGNKINDSPDTLVYHAVDKRQWRGGREIYVMDLKTKRMQQPIEKYMAFLCKKTDTELISIPSDKRSQVIHHALFEKDIPSQDLKNWFLTLDCSKWAPKSMFIKFALMIMPMNSIPSSFKTHFLNYLSLLYKKKLYFNQQEVSVLSKNVNNKDMVRKFLVEDTDVKGFYMIQPYSWVMGIFNYTSSLMHAFNQKYCSYLLKETTLQSYNEECSLFMFAHSDDSGGRLAVSNEGSLVRAIFYYEINLKACNHILSKKKCVISRIYFEILSIIYMFSQLLALLPKFLGGIRFLPTDKGPAHDMLQTYSKGIELMVAGADFNKAYLYQKFYSAEIWRFYHNTIPDSTDYKRPPQHLGMPDAHPMMVLLNGSDSDIIRIIYKGDIDQIILTHRLFKYLDCFESDEGLIKSLKFIVKVRGAKKDFDESIDLLNEILEKWSLSNVNYKNTPMDALSFLKKLNDPGFTGSLLNETEARRMSRAYFFRSGESVSTRIGIKTLKEMMSLIKEVQLLSLSSGEKLFEKFFGREAIDEFLTEINPESQLNKPMVTYFKDTYSNSLKLCDYLDRIDFTKEKLKRSVRTLKPTHIQVVKFGKGFTTTFDPTQLISSIYEPDLSWALPNPSNLNNAKSDFEALMRHLSLKKEDLDPSTALKMVRNHQIKNTKDIYMYSCIPGYIRMIKNFSGMLTFLATNSFHDFEIQGMSLKLRGNLTAPPVVQMSIDEEAYTITTLFDVLSTLDNSINLKGIEINPLPEYSFPGGTIDILIEHFSKRRFSDGNFAYYCHYLEYFRNKHVVWFGRNEGKIFDHGAYYTYLKEQKFRGAWYGKGQIAFYFKGDWVTMDIFNNKIVCAEGSVTGKINKILNEFISDTLLNNNLESGYTDIISKNYLSKNNLYLGYDLSGEVSIENHLNIRSGVPYKYTPEPHPFINKVKSSEVVHVKENMFVCKRLDESDIKIYTLKVERAEVIPLVKKLINPDSIDHYLKSSGFNNFAEFVNQNILVKYGAEYYITLQDLSNGYLGSALYNLYINTQRMDQSLMPKRMDTAKLPAPKGSLLRMILEYQNMTDEEIIKQPKEINPSILSIRNEFPESFSVVLSEKITENFDKIYDDEEQLTLMSEFVKAASHHDSNRVRSACIKLMCYWGYSSLVNVLKLYTFSRTLQNHTAINLRAVNNQTNEALSKCFITLSHAIYSSMRDCFSEIYKNVDWPVGIIKTENLREVWERYIIETVYSAYGYTSPYNHPSLSVSKLNNIFAAFLKEPKFVKKLMDNLKDHYPLNTLEFHPKNTKSCIATVNTLRSIWMSSKKMDPVKFDYIKSYQHLPHNIQSPYSLIKEFNFIEIKSSGVKYNYFSGDSLRYELKRDELTVNAGGVRYVVKQSVTNDLCNTIVQTNDIFRFKRPLTDDYLETDEYSDIEYEMISMDPDIDLIKDSLMDEDFMYKKSEVKKRGRSFIVPVKWVLMPYVEGSENISKYINNSGEHLVILSNCFIKKINELRNYRCYLVNYGRHEGDLPDMLAHVISTNSIPGVFWDKYIGGNRIIDYQHVIDLTYSNIIRSGSQEEELSNLGVFIGNKDIPELGQSEASSSGVSDDKIKPWLEVGLNKKEAVDLYNRKTEVEALEKEIRETLNDYVDRKIIEVNFSNKMFQKYRKALLSTIPLPTQSIVGSLLTELELHNINSGIISGGITNEITSLEHIKMMQAPESFGTATLHSKPDSKSFKDMRYKAELDSIHENLSTKVSSSTLTISSRMFEVVKSHYNIWRGSVDHTKFKPEMKKFFLNIFLSLVNTSSKHSKSTDDQMWQEIVNRMATIIGEEPEDLDIDLSYYLPPSSGLRLKYRTVGFD